jgi:hypothetical protein
MWNLYDMVSTVNSWLSGILIQLAKILKKMYNFYKFIRKQVCNTHMFTCRVVVLSALPHVLHHLGAIAIEARRICVLITVYVSKIFHPSIYYIT